MPIVPGQPDMPNIRAPRGRRTLGVILAGGASRRYGSVKALAAVGGTPVIRRVCAAVLETVAEGVVITGDPAVARVAGLPSRPDLLPGRGPLGGLTTALAWAVERGNRGVLLVACDMPFLDPTLMRTIVTRGETSGARAVVPQSREGRVQPLCGWYSVDLLGTARDRLADGPLDLTGFVAAVGAERLPVGETRRYGGPDAVFLNINVRADRERAERIASERKGSDGRR